MRRSIAAFVLLVLGASFSRGDGEAAGLGELEKKVAATLSSSRTQEKLVFHWNPQVLKPAEVDAAVARNAGFYKDVEKRLAVSVPVPVHVFLYRDVAEMQTLTERAGGVVAFSSGHAVHEAFDYWDCHEMVHIFAQHIPSDADSSPPDTFLVEGLATALQARDRGTAMSDWAAIDLRAGRVPPLLELRRNWPNGCGAGVHPYHVAGSFVDFLIERFGIEKVKRLYTHSLEFQGTLGRSFVALEREWRAWALARAVKPQDEERVLATLGIGPEQRLPPELRDRKGVPLFDGRSLAGWTADAKDVWSVKAGVLTGVNAGKWSRLHTAEAKPDALGVRLRFRVVSGNAFQTRLNETKEGANEAIFAAWQTYLTKARPDGTLEGVVAAAWRFAPGEWTDAVFVNDAGTCRIFVNGFLVATSQAPVRAEPGAIELAVEEGSVEVASVELLRRE